jgi:hypothetical protein
MAQEDTAANRPERQELPSPQPLEMTPLDLEPSKRVEPRVAMEPTAERVLEVVVGEGAAQDLALREMMVVVALEVPVEPAAAVRALPLYLPHLQQGPELVAAAAEPEAKEPQVAVPERRVPAEPTGSSRLSGKKAWGFFHPGTGVA